MVEKRYSRCACGETIRKDSKQCKKCSGRGNSPKKTNLPSDKKILEEVKNTSAAAVARKYDVSYTTIQKILLKYRK